MTAQIDRLTATAEVQIADAIIQVGKTARGNFDILTVRAVLENIDPDDPAHSLAQLELALGFNEGAFAPLEAALVESGETPVGILFGLFAAVAALAAGAFGHALNTNQDRYRLSRPEHTAATVQRYISESTAALRDAANRAIASPGTEQSRTLQLQRTIGLSPAQASSIDLMRRFLLGDIAAAPITANGITRSVPLETRLARVRGMFSAPQIAMLRKALANPAFSPGDIERLLDRHATAMRNHRAKAMAGHAAHAASEGGKLTAWQIVQFFGLLPDTTRRFWRTAGDERVREAHTAVPRLNPVGVALDQAFNTPLGPAFTPPLEIGCRCKAELRHAA